MLDDIYRKLQKLLVDRSCSKNAMASLLVRKD
jgi:hypothetical protein